MLKNQRFSKVDFDVIPFHTDVIGKENLKQLADKNSLLSFIKEAIITETEADELVQESTKWIETPTSPNFTFTFVTSGTKEINH